MAYRGVTTGMGSLHRNAESALAFIRRYCPERTPGSWLSLLPGLRGRLEKECILIAADMPWRCVSSGILGGGISDKRFFVNRQVHKNYNECQPQGETIAFLTGAFPDCPIDQTTALMTAARVSQAAWMQNRCGPIGLSVVVTAGVRNACAAGVTPCWERTPEIGTINIMAFLDNSLTDGALINAVQTITEAKSRVLRELRICCAQTGDWATGTGTDAVVVAARPGGEPLAYAGPTTRLGALLAATAGAALRQAVQAYLSATGRRAGQAKEATGAK
ncbi:conserved domain protein [Heliomicrobium modesticaldum Ice1]|uniref:Conserved domain protein n=1 Tax=Heliobacterium modesticaldum (strain ATCC 51547 / Ice1) TaxID=498761 RepID=B0TF96_HELMI|nr:adenosylcobinamide amidohydrolase [Heliomicrobium modesticaldum]ABZ84413.1 conserved domain protein [Heliomicrobium modesticaldum Ice1]